MKTKDLIKQLQELDPTGEKEVFIGVYSRPTSINNVQYEDIRVSNPRPGEYFYDWDVGTGRYSSPLRAYEKISKEIIINGDDSE